jgi:hypothetical protein
MTPGLLTPDDYRALALELIAPPASATAWDWCRHHLHLHRGKWSEKRAGIMRHWYEIVTARITGQPMAADPWAHRCEELYLVMIAQLAKTTTMQALAGWIMAEHPREIGWYVTRDKDVRRFRRRAILPMIESTPALQRLLPLSQEARDQALGADLIAIGGSLLHLLNGNLLDDVRSLPLALIFLDEFNRLMRDLGNGDAEEVKKDKDAQRGEGDPIDLMKVRQRTMPHDRLLMGATTPSNVTGHGWSRLCSGSHERPLVVCPSCGGVDYLNDLQVCSAGDHKLTEYPPAVILRERLARWTCRWNGCMHNANAVRGMVLESIANRGRWCPGTWSQSDANPSGLWTPQADIDTAGRLTRIHPPETTVRSGWANALYAEDVTLDGFAADMVAKLHLGKPSQKKTWTNTEANRPWIHTFKPTTIKEIAKLCGNYANGSCPAKAEWLILTLDQQGNQAGKFWWAYVLRAWQPGVGSWLVDAGKVMSEAERDDLEDRLYPIGGEQRASDLTVMDIANPHYLEKGYRWAAEQPKRRIVVRGDSRLRPGETWRVVPPPDPSKPSRSNRPPEVNEYRIHPHHWRDELEQCITGESDLPWHLSANPGGQPVNDDKHPNFYLRSLNSQDRTVDTRRVTGGGFEEVVIWVPRVTSQTDESTSVRKDLHWADCEKMQLAVVDIFGLDKAPENGGSANPGKTGKSDDDAEAVADAGAYTDGVW